MIVHFQSTTSKESKRRSSVNMEKIILHLIDITFEDPKGINTHSMLTKNWYTSETSVQALNLDNVKLFLIQADAFNTIHFRKMTNLMIRSRIEFLHEGTFNGLNNLKVLSLVNTKIKIFVKNILAPLRSLEWFVMDCGIDEKHPLEIHVDNLFGAGNFSKINQLSIFNCNLRTTIDRSTFIGITNISILLLELNRIEVIGDRSFDTVFPTLNQLSLAMNDLKTLPADIFSMSKRKTIIEIDENPWHCDCKLENLRLFLLRSEHIFLPSIVCNSPKKYAGQKLIAMPPLCIDHSLSTKSPTAAERATENDAQLIPNDEEHTPHLIHDFEVNLTTGNSLLPMTLLVYVPKHTSNSAVTQDLLNGKWAHFLLFHFWLLFLWF